MKLLRKRKYLFILTVSFTLIIPFYLILTASSNDKFSITSVDQIGHKKQFNKSTDLIVFLHVTKILV